MVAWKNGDVEVSVLQVYCSKPIPRTNTPEDAFLCEQSERQLVQFKTRVFRIGLTHRSFEHDEVQVVKLALHLGRGLGGQGRMGA